jgi:hypothetical protein
MVERRLRQTTARLRGLREELRIIDEQLEQLADEADDYGLRSLVSESPADRHDHREAKSHAEAMATHRAHVVQSIAELERRQDELLDAMTHH